MQDQEIKNDSDFELKFENIKKTDEYEAEYQRFLEQYEEKNKSWYDKLGGVAKGKVDYEENKKPGKRTGKGSEK